MLTTLVHHPRKLCLRKALFQVHLWLGILLSLYVIVISLSGAMLVFEEELRAAALPAVRFDASRVASIPAVIAKTHQLYPTSNLTYISVPTKTTPRWGLFLEDKNGKTRTVFADANTGEAKAGSPRLFVDWVLDLHVYLLMGRTGFIVNCLAGIGLFVLAITGAILWWPGLKLWRRGLGVSLRGRWRRVNYDLHSAIGFWTLFLVSWWGFTAICFLFPTQVTAVVNAVSPLKGMKEPIAPKPSPSPAGIAPAVASIETILQQQPRLSPGTLTGISLPETSGGNVILYIDRAQPGDFSHRDIDTFDGHTGKLLTLWHYGEKQSLGDWLVWLVYPLHFGTLWGMPIKILWCLLGVALAVLSVTGVLMYWNRYLGARWRALSER
jgi:uncharacterized iron-regulated membrane protein